MSRPPLGDAKLVRVSVPLHRATIAAYAARAEAEGRPARAIMRAELERGCAPPIPICTTWITRGDARAGDGEVREAPGAERMSRTDKRAEALKGHRAAVARIRIRRRRKG